jgi:ABC-type branched-subunit amino acid transport system ATPase component
MTAMLHVKDLRAYYGQVQALHGLEFELQEGSLTTLLGANGAGKTTTLRSICNMIRSTGSIEFEAVQRLDLAVIRTQVFYVKHRGHESLSPR